MIRDIVLNEKYMDGKDVWQNSFPAKQPKEI